MQLKLWPDIYRRKLQIVTKNVRFPPFINQDEWMFQFRLCTTLRLFFPTVSTVSTHSFGK